MKTFKLKPLTMALSAMLVAAPALAVDLDFSGSDIYMKFLDGNHRTESGGSIDTASGSDKGQFTELELKITARVAKEVEAGARVQSRSSGAYWSEFNGFANEDTQPEIRKRYMKLRGAYISLTPGYSWLNQALLGSSDWGMFDPFTVGKMRYIDRDNINGVYLRGPLGLEGSSYDVAWITLAQYLGPNFATTDTPSGLQKNDGTYVLQLKVPVMDYVKLAGSVQYTRDRERDASDTNLYDGQETVDRFRNTVWSLRAESGAIQGLDLKGAYYHSRYDVNTAVQNWSNLLGADYNDDAWLATADWATPLPGFGVAAQVFDIGAGYVSAVGARRESDVLLTDGSESAWYGWGDPKYIGGLANDMLQVPVTIRDNDFADFDETGAESAIGWKGITGVLKYEVLDTPMSFEYTKLDYNQNWQNWGGNQAVFDVISWAGATGPNFKANTDRSTDIYVLKVGHVFPLLGGLDTSLKAKWVLDEDDFVTSDPTDNRKTDDKGYSATVGNQLFRDLYGAVSYGYYTRDITKGTAYSGCLECDTNKSIYGLRFSYNLTGFELGYLVQYIDGSGFPDETTEKDVRQYRMKAFAKVLF